MKRHSQWREGEAIKDCFSQSRKLKFSRKWHFDKHFVFPTKMESCSFSATGKQLIEATPPL